MIKFTRYFLKSIVYPNELHYTKTVVSPGFNTKNTVKLARAATKAAWGEVHSCKKVFDNTAFKVYSTSTPGHGGFVVIAKDPIDHPNFIDEFTANQSSNAGEYGGYVYTLEEDCNWALLALILDWGDLCKLTYKAYPSVMGPEEVKEMYVSCLKQWHNITDLTNTKLP